MADDPNTDGPGFGPADPPPPPPLTLDELRAGVIFSAKRTAEALITARWPLWRQINLAGDDADPVERAAFRAYRDAVRAAVAAIEAQAAAALDLAALAAIQPTQESPRWPKAPD